MIVSVSGRRLKKRATPLRSSSRSGRPTNGSEGPTPVFNGPSLDDPRLVISIGFVAVTPDEVRDRHAAGSEGARTA